MDTCLELQNVCANESITGFDGVVCRLDLVDATLHGPPLASRQLTTRLQRKLAKARTFVEAARKTTSKRTVRRADKALAAFIAVIKRSQRSGRLAYAVAEELLARSTDAAAQLRPLR
jgi:alkylation response protein AidB-like acyl-CoA dehydrogenase